MSRRDLARELESLLRTKREHEGKLAQAQGAGDPGRVSWLKKEIVEMDRRIRNLQDNLNTTEETCPNCKKLVVPVSNRCPKCNEYMG